jgi:hypothetical protein
VAVVSEQVSNFEPFNVTEPHAPVYPASQLAKEQADIPMVSAATESPPPLPAAVQLTKEHLAIVAAVDAELMKIAPPSLAS